MKFLQLLMYLLAADRVLFYFYVFFFLCPIRLHPFLVDERMH